MAPCASCGPGARRAARVSSIWPIGRGLSARHLSFIETGRTQPSRQALLTIGEALEMPLRQRNRLLEAGGYARVYRQTPLEAEEMSHVRGLLQFVLDRHEPYGTVVAPSGASRPS